MPSSISSSEACARRGAVRPATDRHPTGPASRSRCRCARCPQQPWGGIMLGALAAVCAAGRRLGDVLARLRRRAGIRNSYGLWAIQRRRIDAGEGDATVLIGASRMLFDIAAAGVGEPRRQAADPAGVRRHIAGTAIEDLAADPNFTGRLLVGVAPDIFFTGFEYRDAALPYTRKESPSQRIGQWLSMRLVEPLCSRSMIRISRWRPCSSASPGRSGRACTRSRRAQARRRRRRPQHVAVGQGRR